MRSAHSVFFSLFYSLILLCSAGHALASTNFDVDDYEIYRGDVNGDGYEDIYLHAKQKFLIIAAEIAIPIPFTSGTSLLINGDTGAIQEWTADVNISQLQVADFKILMGDFNGDGLQDLLLQGKSASEDSLIIYGASGNIPTKIVSFDSLEGQLIYSEKLVIKDINNDGRDDLVIQGASSTIAFANAQGEFNTSLPSNPDTIVPGSLPGEFSVGNTGALSYSIPIAVPVGGAGMQPQLAFNYNSSSGNGLLGMGWNVTQSSSIHRCVPPNTKQRIQFKSTDSFCLDGGLLLRQFTSDRYHLENSISERITSHGTTLVGDENTDVGPQYFKVEYKSGEIAYYGNYNNVNAFNHLDGAYYLAEILDRSGNKRSYVYEKDLVTGIHKLKKVIYPGGEIEYSYDETRIDTAESWFAGQRSIHSERISRVETRTNNLLYRSYDLAYSYSPLSNKSRLESITECALDGSCLAPMRFDWSELGSGTFSESPTFINQTSSNGENRLGFFIDINNDGYDDLFSYSGVRFNNGDGTLGPYQVTGLPPVANPSGAEPTALRFFNYDNDEYPDFLIPDGSSDDYFVLEYNGTSFDYTRTLSTRDGWDKNPVILDMDGNGRSDILYNSGGKRYIRYRITSLLGVDYWKTKETKLSDNGWRTAHAVDLDGDGKQEIVYRHSTQGLKVIRGTYDPTSLDIYEPANPEYFKEYALNVSIAEEDIWAVTWTDFNSDGLTDLIYVQNGKFYLRINNGNAFNGNDIGLNPAVEIQGIKKSDINSNARLIHDINYDDDDYRDWILSLNSSGGSILKVLRQTGDLNCYSTGQNCFETLDLPFPISQSIYFKKKVYTPDLNNDGFEDIVGNADYWTIQEFGILMREPSTGQANYLSSVTNGFGLETNFLYGKAELTQSNSDLYSKASGATIENTKLIAGPINIVSSISINKSENWNEVIQYSYEDLITQTTGYGLLGFKKITAISSNRSKSVTSFNHDYINKQQGFVEQIDNYINDQNVWKLTSQTSNDFLSDRSNFSWNIYLRTSVEKEWELDGSLIKRMTSVFSSDTTGKKELYGHQDADYYSFNNFSNSYSGNITSSTITVSNADGSDSYTTSTTSNYDDEDFPNWNLGRITSSTVTHSGTDRATTTKNSAWEYYTDGRLWKEIIEPDDPALALTTSYTYNTLGLKETVTTSGAGALPRGVTTHYDSLGRYPISVTSDSGTVSTSYHPLFGKKVSTKDLNGLTQYWTYDGIGRIKSTFHPDGTYLTTEFKFANSSSPKSKYRLNEASFKELSATYYIESIDNNGVWSQTYFDKLGKPFERRSLDAFNSDSGDVVVASRTEYDRYGSEYRVSEPFKVDDTTATIYWTTTTSRDPLNRPLTVTTQTGDEVSFTYEGLAKTIINEKGYIKKEITSIDGKLKEVFDVIQFDAEGNAVDNPDDNSNKVSYTYDGSGNMTAMKDVTANLTTIINYDNRGRKTSMNDPNKGLWLYDYNIFGELVLQTDAENIKICQVYDTLGRMIKRIDNYQGDATTARNDCSGDETNTNVSEWIYDLAANGQGQLYQVTGPNGYSETYEYDELSRPLAVTKVIAGSSYRTATTYDEQSRPSSQTYPSGLKAFNHYNDKGVLTEIRKADNDNYYWRLDSTDHRGNPTRVSLASGAMETQKTYTPDRGFVESIVTSTPTNVGDLQFDYVQYDELANVSFRRNDVVNSQETASYDNLNRLIKVERVVKGVVKTPELMEYHYNGNIKKKWDVTGEYAYDGSCNAGPHAVSSANGNSYCYDLNGSMVSGAGRTIQWSAFGKPTSLSKGTTSVQFDYAPDRGRIRRIDIKNNLTTTTTYVGSYEKVEKPSGVVDERHYIGGFVVINKVTNGTQVDTKENYLFKDNLGSVVSTVDLSALLASPSTYKGQATAFNPWGLRRNSDWGDMSLASLYDFKSDVTDRGFTGHEQIDELGLIHMNGRVYDPILGRFISADPIIQSPTDLQSLNRYSYVRNNPLSLTDPSGFSWWSKQWKKWGKDFTLNAITMGGYSTLKAASREFGRFAKKNKYIAEITQIAGCVTVVGCMATTAFVTYSLTGDVLATVTATALAGWQAAASGAIGLEFGSPELLTLAGAGAVVSHATVGGVFSTMGGGEFKNGFIAGGFGKALTLGLNNSGSLYNLNSKGGYVNTGIGNIAARTSIAAFGGGTASKLSGGNFANGARTAAMQHLFNAERVDDPANNQWKVIKREFADWWGGNDTADLRMGLGVAADVASIPYKGVAAALDVKTAASVTVDLANGNYGQAAVDTASIVAGKYTFKLLTDMTKSTDMLKSTVGLGIEKSSNYILQQDCMNCENR
tara:strand:- start:461 stop:7405 length:6945 start_codon:yes stop_codon:yes gene_type:complete